MSDSNILTRLSEELLSEADRLAVVRAHVYGYRFGKGGEIEIVPEEARVIEDVLTQLATIRFMKCQKILTLISDEYRKSLPQIRNRSGQPFTVKKLALLCKPLYAGLERNQFGVLAKVKNYPPIIEMRTYKSAYARLRRESLIE